MKSEHLRVVLRRRELAKIIHDFMDSMPKGYRRGCIYSQWQTVNFALLEIQYEMEEVERLRKGKRK